MALHCGSGCSEIKFSRTSGVTLCSHWLRSIKMFLVLIRCNWSKGTTDILNFILQVFCYQIYKAGLGQRDTICCYKVNRTLWSFRVNSYGGHPRVCRRSSEGEVNSQASLYWPVGERGLHRVHGWLHRHFAWGFVLPILLVPQQEEPTQVLAPGWQQC